MFNRDLLIKSVKQFDIELSELQILQFEKYIHLLKQWNEKINLTAILDEDEIIIKHFYDSLSIYPHIKQYMEEHTENISLIDVGTGAGFPGIPLKIVFPSISLTLLDSLEKRIKFLDVCIQELSIKDTTLVSMRAEVAGRDIIHREKYDICTARAVAKLPILLELCMPFVTEGGKFIALKGNDKNEMEESTKAINVLCGEIKLTQRLNLPQNMGNRTILVIVKNKQLSTKYPRNYAAIAKNFIK